MGYVNRPRARQVSADGGAASELEVAVDRLRDVEGDDVAFLIGVGDDEGRRTRLGGGSIASIRRSRLGKFPLGRRANSSVSVAVTLNPSGSSPSG